MPRRLLKKADGTLVEYGGGGSSELEKRVGKVEKAIADKADSSTVPNAAAVAENTLKMQRKTTAEDGTESVSELFEVELPSGGGSGEEWELIADVTLTEEVNIITVFSGEIGYKNIGMILDAYAPTVNTDTSTVNVHVYSESTGFFNPLIKVGSRLPSGDRTTAYRIDSFGGMVITQGAVSVTDGGNTGNGNFAFSTRNSISNPIKSLYIQLAKAGTEWAYFGVRTRVRAWGVRA